MARLTFTLPGGEQQSFTLYSDRRIRIGRERNNEISLRDARISRTHAELTFERGFYVIRDLGSSNGTWVNGNQVRVAPLTDGAELKMGSTVGRFSEELDQDTPARWSDSDKVSATNEVAWPAEAGSEEPGVTRPNPKGRPEDISDPDFYDDQRPTAELPDDRKRGTRDTSIIPTPSKYTITIPDPDETGRIIDQDDRAILFFRAAWDLAALIAPIIASVMLVSGFFGVLSLVLRGAIIPAIGGTALTALFSWAVLALAPRRRVELFRDEELDEIFFRLSQQSASFPRTVFNATDASGNLIAVFVSRAFSLGWEARRELSVPAFATLRRRRSSFWQIPADLLNLPIPRRWRLGDASSEWGSLETDDATGRLEILEPASSDLRIPLSLALLTILPR